MCHVGWVCGYWHCNEHKLSWQHPKPLYASPPRTTWILFRVELPTAALRVASLADALPELFAMAASVDAGDALTGTVQHQAAA